MAKAGHSRARGLRGERIVRSDDAPARRGDPFTARSGATVHGILCGGSDAVPTLELSVSATIRQRRSTALPGILDVTCQPFVHHAAIRIDPQFEGRARQVTPATIGVEPIRARVIIVVDADADICDRDDAKRARPTRCRPDKDMRIIPDTPPSCRDQQTDHRGRLPLAATRPSAREAEFGRKTLRMAGAVRRCDRFDGA